MRIKNARSARECQCWLAYWFTSLTKCLVKTFHSSFADPRIFWSLTFKDICNAISLSSWVMWRQCDASWWVITKSRFLDLRSCQNSGPAVCVIILEGPIYLEPTVTFGRENERSRNPIVLTLELRKGEFGPPPTSGKFQRRSSAGYSKQHYIT